MLFMPKSSLFEGVELAARCAGIGKRNAEGLSAKLTEGVIPYP